jgi:DHA2 family multidrug resistance protein-like MFS transporter
VLPEGLGAAARGQAGETLGGALGVAEGLPAGPASALTESARAAFDSGVGLTSVIAVALMLVAAAAVQLSMRPRPRTEG